MTILYALVARGSVVLAEFSSTATNANAIARQILDKIPGNDDSNVSFSQDRYIFHVKRTDGLAVLCMADETAGRTWDSRIRATTHVGELVEFVGNFIALFSGTIKLVCVQLKSSLSPRQGEEFGIVRIGNALHAGRIPFAFLEEIHQRFVRTYGRAVIAAQAYAMNDEFSRVLSQQMEYYTNDPNADKINRLKGEMSQVRHVMIENIDKVLERGDRLELLVDKTANMQGNTFRFRKQARRFSSALWWRNVKLTVALILLLLVIIYVVLGFVCHGVTLPTCRK
ncbi:hypothetical protein OIU77_031428 [Salix suchowensis]|uniref:Uncharacterized protein n=1 Tax=Salix suchowensis TaxID=1278906 RepID=A0ABQ9BFH0_9ROSI|nr:hypothetical protein OIU77_031428 [Salix suchowensis]